VSAISAAMKVSLKALLLALRIKEPLLPGPARRGAGEPDALMQSRRTIAPELDLDRRHQIAAQMVRSRRIAACELLFVSLHRRFEIAARGERTRLLTRPGADLAP